MIGVVEIKFEAGMKRPKLRSNAHVPSPRNGVGQEPMKEVASTETKPAHMTVRLPQARTHQHAATTKSDAAYVSGTSAINYSDLAQPEVKEKSFPWMIIIWIAVVIILGAAYYFFLYKH
jgi:hypothetical protein